MKAVVITEPGEPEVLELREVERPTAGPDEILVRVRASGLNRADLFQRRGRYPVPEGWPEDIPGMEFSGVVEEAGSGCRLHAVADRVMGVIGGGGYAQYVVLHERTAVRVPEPLDLRSAGAVPEVFVTAFDALFLQMGLVAGETLLIHAIGSGVGTAALQLARAAGVRTIGTSRTPEKLTQAKKLGLDVPILANDSWADQVLAETGGEGVDVLLDLVGAPYLASNLKVLARRGRLIVVGVSGGSLAEIDLRELMRRRALLAGTVLRARPLEEKIVLARAFEARVAPLFRSGALEPVVDRVYPAEEVVQAHRRMEGNLNFGKILLLWE